MPSLLPSSISHTDQPGHSVGRYYSKVWILGGWLPQFPLPTTHLFALQQVNGFDGDFLFCFLNTGFLGKLKRALFT